MIAGACPAYLPPISYMAWMTAQKEVAFILTNHYQKQTYRNRAQIYGANGLLKLTIPIAHNKNAKHQLDGDVAIHYESSWQKDHWKSLESAYRSSPFFEFYEAEFYPFFHQKEAKLMDLNIALIIKILNLLESEVNILKTEEAITEFSDLVDAKKEIKYEIPPYRQVFDSKFGFIPNLSVLDLIFNLGPQSLDFLKKIKV